LEDNYTNEIHEIFLLTNNESSRASEIHKIIIIRIMTLADLHLSYVDSSINQKEWDDNKTILQSKINKSLDEYNNSRYNINNLIIKANNKIIERRPFKYVLFILIFLNFLVLMRALKINIQIDYGEGMLEEIQADNRRLKDTMKVLEDLLSRDAADAWRNKARIFYGYGNYDESLKAYKKVLEIDPLDSLAWMSIGDIFQIKGKYDKAILAYNKAIKGNPNSASIWRKKGAALMIKGKLDNAIEAYNRSIEIDPSDAITWDNRGWALSYLGKYDEAIQSFEKAINIDPTDASAWCNSGKALKAVNRNNEANIAFATAKTLGYPC